MYRSPPREEESQLRERIQQLRSDLELAEARADMWREQAKVSRLKLRESKKRRSKPPSKFVRPPRPKPKRFVEQRLRRENAWLSQEQDRLRSELQDARTEQSGVAKLGHAMVGASIPLLFIKAWPLFGFVAVTGLLVSALR